MNAIVKKISEELEKKADEKTKNSGKHFFKEKVTPHGVKTAIVSRIAKEYFKEVKNKPKEEIFALCEELFASGYLEESFIACHWSYLIRKQFEKKDFDVFESWVRKYISNWASCDTLCNHTIGTFIELFPSSIARVKKWATSSNRWMRRASAVTFIIPAKKGLFLEEIFAVADILLLDSDDLVQKGYGWMLKSASQARCKEVFAYVMDHKKTMPRTALRYAIEKMPEQLQKKAMEKE